jgi:hypothetical protein
MSGNPFVSFTSPRALAVAGRGPHPSAAGWRLFMKTRLRFAKE